MKATVKCPRCRRYGTVAGDLFYCPQCKAGYDDDPDEGGNYHSVDPSRRMHNEETHRRPRR